MSLKSLQQESNKKLQKALDRIVILSSNNNLYIKDISQTFSVLSEINMAHENQLKSKVRNMEEGKNPEYQIKLILHMGKFNNSTRNSSPGLGNSILQLSLHC